MADVCCLDLADKAFNSLDSGNLSGVRCEPTSPNRCSITLLQPVDAGVCAIFRSRRSFDSNGISEAAGDKAPA